MRARQRLEQKVAGEQGQAAINHGGAHTSHSPWAMVEEITTAYRIPTMQGDGVNTTADHGAGVSWCVSKLRHDTSLLASGAPQCAS